MTAATVENMEHKKARAEEANLLLEGLDEVTQKALYIATKMVLAKRDTEEGTGKPEQPKREQNQEAFNKRLAKFREKWKEY